MARVASLLHRPWRFPKREGNRIELLVDGHRFLPAMVDAIGGSRHYVLLELYLIESGTVTSRFVDAIWEATRRGVSVCLLFDDFGARGLNPTDRQRLRLAGAELKFYNPLRYGHWFSNLARDHRKLLLVDGDVVFVGGAGLTDEFDPPREPTRRWRETVVRVEGPVVRDWYDLFGRVWSQQGGAWPVGRRPEAPAFADGVSARVVVAAGPGRQEIQRDALRHIRAATRRVWIMTAYFVPSWRFRRALAYAARQGVDVRLLLPGPISDHPAVRHAGRRFYGHLLRAGVRIFEYQPRFLHAKAAVCDDWVSMGSSNLDRWALRWNLEANQEVEDASFAGQVYAMFEADFADAVECDPDRWRRRPWRERLRERFWGGVDRWLHRLGQGRAR